MKHPFTFTNFEQLLDRLNRSIIFSQVTISEKSLFQLMTSEVVRPVITNRLARNIFTKLHEEICDMENVDCFVLYATSAAFLKTVHADELLASKLTVEEIEHTPNSMVVTWKQTIKDSAGSQLTQRIKVGYYTRPLPVRRKLKMPTPLRVSAFLNF